MLEAYRQREDGANIRAGLITAAVYNCAFGRSKSSRVFKPTDFFKSPSYGPRPRQGQESGPDWRIQFAGAYALAKRQGKVVDRGRNLSPLGEDLDLAKQAEQAEQDNAS